MTIAINSKEILSFGNRIGYVADAAFSGAYPFGGDSLNTEELLGIHNPDIVMIEPANGYRFQHDKANGKVKAFTRAPLIVYDEPHAIDTSTGIITLKYPAAFIMNVAQSGGLNLKMRSTGLAISGMSTGQCSLVSQMEKGVRTQIRCGIGTTLDLLGGDGAFTGGMIYEALNNCADKDRLIIILNDNEMSISPNVGGMSNYFRRFRTTARYFRFKNFLKSFFGGIPFIGKALVKIFRKFKNGMKRLLVSENFFEVMGISYYGPLDGNNTKHLETVLKEAKKDGKCSVVHIITKKGKGYSFAEEKPDLFHSVKGFDIGSGELKNGYKKSFSEFFGELITKAGATDRNICAVTAAMGNGTGLDSFEEAFPERFFDVGIAEGHALTFSAGLASQGKKPVFAVYSTFFQRAYDQLLHDAALQELPIILALDRAGLVPDDGPTHHGVFDVSIVNGIPNTEIYSPDSFEELTYSFENALKSKNSVSIRYPKGAPDEYDRSIFKNIDGKSYCDFGRNPATAIITYGKISKNALYAAAELYKNNINTRVIKLVRIKPIDYEALSFLTEEIDNIYVLEEGIKAGGVGENIAAYFAENCISTGKRIKIRAINNVFVGHGDIRLLYKDCGFLPEQIFEEITDFIKDNAKINE